MYRRAIFALFIFFAGQAFLVAQTESAKQQATNKEQQVVVQPDGTIELPAMTVPLSKFLSPEAKAYVVKHLHDVQNPKEAYADRGLPRFLAPILERQRTLYAVQREEAKIGGVRSYIFTPSEGVSPANATRVLINLHGGAFLGGFPGVAELESRPIAALGKIKVVSVDYRLGPENQFPAASASSTLRQGQKSIFSEDDNPQRRIKR